jgi:hypothetical protein
MSIQRVPLAAIQHVRQHIQSAIAVDSAKQSQIWSAIEETDEIPEPTSIDDLSGIFAFGRLSQEEIAAPHLQTSWSISMINPGAALLKLPGIQLKPEWRLVGYLYRDQNRKDGEESGVGLVFAVPEELATTARLEAALPASKTLQQPPQPAGALTDFMEAIDGDRSAVSFIVASLLYRELREFAAKGAYCNWTYHRLIDAVPAKVQWQWQTEQPQDLTPKVKVLADGQALVEFFTCRVKAGVGLYRHVDQYPSSQYRAKRVNKLLATARR